MFPRLRGQGVRRLGWGVADQGLSSLTNLAVTLSVARTLGAEQFGAFSLAYVTYGFALTASRALATDPLIVRFGGADPPTWRRAVAGCTGTAGAVGLAAGACVLAVAALTQGTAKQAFLALGLMLPGLLLQDSWRYAFFAVGRGGQAFLNDMIWAAGLLPALVLVRVTGHENVFWFVIAWGTAAAVAAVVGSLQARVLPRLSASRAWLSQHRDLGLRYLAEATSSSAAIQARTYGIGLILGLAAVGYVQAAYTLMGPLMIMLFGTVAVMVPEVARVLRRSPRHVPMVCLAYGGSLAAVALAWGVVLLVVLPRGLGDLLLGQIWGPTYPLVPLVTLAFMGGSIQAGAGVGLRALGAARRSLRAMILSSIVLVVGALVGAVEGGTVGTMLGAAVAAWIGALLWWWQLRAALRESEKPPAHDQYSSRRPAGRHRRRATRADLRRRSSRPAEPDGDHVHYQRPDEGHTTSPTSQTRDAEPALLTSDSPYQPPRDEYRKVRYGNGGATRGCTPSPNGLSHPLVIATILREEGITGVHTHFRQLCRYLEESDRTATIVTPFSWSRTLAVPVFGPRLVLERCSGTANVAWYRHWHEVFLQKALRSRLAEVGDCVVYAQCPLSARAALRARRGPHQRVVMAVHFSVSQADEWAVKKQIDRDGAQFRAIRQVEREVIPQVDGLVYVSGWAQNALLDWLPEAGGVPSAVIDNFVAPLHFGSNQEPIGDLVTIGGLLLAKNHRFLLDVLAAAKRSGRSLTLDVFGEGPLRKDLQRRTRSLGLEGQVRFRGFRRDVRDFLPGYRAYVHASYSESSSLAIIEAMAAGLPIVAGNIGPIAELCDDGVEARFWSLDDPAQAAATLLDLLDFEPARLMAASAARERFHRDFDADLVAPRLWSFLMGMTPTAARARSPQGAESPALRAGVISGR